MLKQYEELSVLEQGDDGGVVSVSGQAGPSVLLGASYVEHLAVVAARAQAQLRSISIDNQTNALRLLCSEIQTLVGTFEETRNKFYGGPPIQASAKAALAEAIELRIQLETNLRQIERGSQWP
jgi:hypothetical protein